MGGPLEKAAPIWGWHYAYRATHWGPRGEVENNHWLDSHATCDPPVVQQPHSRSHTMAESSHAELTELTRRLRRCDIGDASPSPIWRKVSGFVRARRT